MTQLTTTEPRALVDWNDSSTIEEIKEIYGKGLNNNEFKTFIQMGKATGLNPFLREVWAVKYGNNPANIFIARDGYRVAAQRQPDYDYHHVDAVYSKDEFKVTNGVVHHEYSAANRGVLLGAYCSVKRHSSSRETFVYVDLAEYDLKQSVWKEKKQTMIKKVAEAQALRSAFQAVFSGTYSEAEQEHVLKDVTPEVSQTEKLKEKIAEKAEPKPEPIIIEQQVDSPARQSLLDSVTKLVSKSGISGEVIAKQLAFYKVDCFDSMTDDQLIHYHEKLQEYSAK